MTLASPCTGTAETLSDVPSLNSKSNKKVAIVARLADYNLRKIYGITLPTQRRQGVHGDHTMPKTPITSAVMEYFRFGPLDEYLRHAKDSGSPVPLVDLVEAGTTLASALHHLEQLNVVHGNIRYVHCVHP